MIYFIACEAAGAVKIGFTASDPERRLADMQTGCPLPLRIIAVVEGSYSDEQAIHAAVGSRRLMREWYSRNDAMRILRMLRRAPNSALAALSREAESERRIALRKAAFIAKASRRVAQMTASFALDHGILSIASQRTWKRALTGESLPSTHLMFDSLNWRPEPLLWLWQRLRAPNETVMPALAAILTEANHIRGVGVAA